MPPADRDARGVARHERHRDPIIRLNAAQQLVRVEQTECKADDRRDRRERDVALREIQADAQHFAALVVALADDAGIGDRAGVGADARAGQAEAGNLIAAREAWQQVILLFLGAVVHQQFRRAQ